MVINVPAQVHWVGVILEWTYSGEGQDAIRKDASVRRITFKLST